MNYKNLTLDFSGKEIKFSFGLGFIGEVVSETNESLATIGQNLQTNSFKYLPLLMWKSHEYNCYREGVPCELKLIDFIDLIDDNGGVSSKQALEFLKVFTLSLTGGVPKDDKKKVVKKEKVRPITKAKD